VLLSAASLGAAFVIIPILAAYMLIDASNVRARFSGSSGQTAREGAGHHRRARPAVSALHPRQLITAAIIGRR